MGSVRRGQNLSLGEVGGQGQGCRKDYDFYLKLSGYVSGDVEAARTTSQTHGPKLNSFGSWVP